LVAFLLSEVHRVCATVVANLDRITFMNWRQVVNGLFGQGFGRAAFGKFVPLLAVGTLIVGMGAECVAGITVDMKGLNWGPHAAAGTKVTLDPPGSYHATDDLKYGGAFLWDVRAVHGGVANFAPIPAPYSSVPNADIVTFCLQFNDNFSFGTNYNGVSLIPLSTAPDAGIGGAIGSPMGANVAGMISWLWEDHFATVFNPANSTALTNLYAGAFQLAIWELQYDHTNPSSFLTGNLTAAHDQSVGGVSLLTTAMSWVNQAITDYNNHNQTAPTNLSLAALSLHGFQDQIVALTPPPTPQAVPAPEPASVAVWLMLGLALAVPSLRRRGVPGTSADAVV
jgi:hypothetical protein